MRSPHARQRPRSATQDTTGTLSTGATGVPQLGQRDRGRITDSRRGTRWMTTFRNDPTASPRTPHTTARNAVTMRTLTPRSFALAHPSTGAAGGVSRLAVVRRSPTAVFGAACALLLPLLLTSGIAEPPWTARYAFLAVEIAVGVPLLLALLRLRDLRAPATAA